MPRSRRAPLEGTRVLVTRAERRDGPLCRLLRARGATVVHWPAYRIVPGPMRRLKAALAAEDYDWIVFSSANAVRAVAACGIARPSHARVAVVGDATAKAVRALGWPVHLKPRVANAAAFARALIARGMRGRRVLFPRSARAPGGLAAALRGADARVDAVVAYRLLPPRRANGAHVSRPQAAFDAVTFTSPSTIEGLERRLGSARARALLARTPSIVIGTTTARALEARGVRAAALARPTTLEGLVAAVERTMRHPRRTPLRIGDPS